MLENSGLSLKGNVENIPSMDNISIMLKTYGKTRAQHAILENWASPKRKKRGGGSRKIPSGEGQRGTRRSSLVRNHQVWETNPVS